MSIDSVKHIPTEISKLEARKAKQEKKLQDDILTLSMKLGCDPKDFTVFKEAPLSLEQRPPIDVLVYGNIRPDVSNTVPFRYSSNGHIKLNGIFVARLRTIEGKMPGSDDSIDWWLPMWNSEEEHKKLDGSLAFKVKKVIDLPVDFEAVVRYFGGAEIKKSEVTIEDSVVSVLNHLKKAGIEQDPSDCRIVVDEGEIVAELSWGHKARNVALAKSILDQTGNRRIVRVSRKRGIGLPVWQDKDGIRFKYSGDSEAVVSYSESNITHEEYQAKLEKFRMTGEAFDVSTKCVAGFAESVGIPPRFIKLLPKYNDKGYFSGLQVGFSRDTTDTNCDTPKLIVDARKEDNPIWYLWQQSDTQKHGLTAKRTSYENVLQIGRIENFRIFGKGDDKICTALRDYCRRAKITGYFGRKNISIMVDFDDSGKLTDLYVNSVKHPMYRSFPVNYFRHSVGETYGNHRPVWYKPIEIEGKVYGYSQSRGTGFADYLRENQD